MRQLITRIDDPLHQALKVRARAEGRSVNSLVNDILEQALHSSSERALVRARIKAAGLAVYPTVTGPVLSRDEVIEATRGAGTAVSEALMRERRGE